MPVTTCQSLGIKSLMKQFTMPRQVSPYYYIITRWQLWSTSKLKYYKGPIRISTSLGTVHIQGITEDCHSQKDQYSCWREWSLPGFVQTCPPLRTHYKVPTNGSLEFHLEFSRKAGPVYLELLFIAAPFTRPGKHPYKTIFCHYKTIHLSAPH